MYCGSIAIALSDPYGDGSSGEVSVIGRSWSRRWPAKASHAAVRSRSPISPIPQLRADGIENNGHSRPARRSLGPNVMNENDAQKIGERSDYPLRSRGGEGASEANLRVRANASANVSSGGMRLTTM